MSQLLKPMLHKASSIYTRPCSSFFRRRSASGKPTGSCQLKTDLLLEPTKKKLNLKSDPNEEFKEQGDNTDSCVESNIDDEETLEHAQNREYLGCVSNVLCDYLNNTCTSNTPSEPPLILLAGIPLAYDKGPPAKFGYLAPIVARKN